MRPRDREQYDRLDEILADFHANVRPLPGIQAIDRRVAFLEQVLESIHRVDYIGRGLLRRGDQPRILDPQRADPHSELFDPLKAAAIQSRDGDHDEACWLVFLFTHFGKHLRTGHRLVRDVYGHLGDGSAWNWTRTSSDPDGFRSWLKAVAGKLRSDGVKRYFGNHRKYISLDADSPGGTGQAIATYVGWVTPHGGHAALFGHAAQAEGFDARRTFERLYRSMGAVSSFGRTGRFDYLTMIGKLELAPIEPGSAYISGSTGPVSGARLLFGSTAADATPRQLDGWLVEVEGALGLRMGMQILEDSLCNWQKNPTRFVPFRG